MISVIDVITAREVPFRVILIPAGEPSPNRQSKAPLTEALPWVEFYDRRHEGFHPGVGQFVADYYAEDLPLEGGLNLYGNEADWSIDADTLALIRSWIWRD